MNIYNRNEIPKHLVEFFEPAEIGLEATPAEYVAAMVEVFALVRELLADDGVLWLNLGDSYAGSGKGAYADGQVRLTDKSQKQRTSTGTHQGAFTKAIIDGLKPKDLVGIPWRVAFALQADGWYLRQDIIWHKPNPMPESVRDRCTKAHEYIFLLSKSDKYFFDSEAMKEPAINAGKRVSLGEKSFSKGQAAGAGIAASGNGTADFYDVPEARNKRSVWTVATKPYKGAHFATFPPALIEPCILAGSRIGDTVLDCFFGSGTTGEVAGNLGRNWIGCEINDQYAPLQQARTTQRGLAL